MNTLKRVAFAKHYVATGNGAEAARLAGYAPSSARQESSRLLTNADVREAVDEERARLRERSDLKAQDVIDGLRSIAEDEKAPHSSRVQAWKALGQTLGLFDERIEVEHRINNGAVDALREFSLSELRALLASQEPIIEAEVRVVGEGATGILNTE